MFLKGHEQARSSCLIRHGTLNAAVCRDPLFYPDFDEFRPDRYLDASDPAAASFPFTHDTGHVTYGFGRR